jgi:CheY-like chemotaxis protein
MPHVCVTDGKSHVRKFLREALSEFGLTIYECEHSYELAAELERRPPDLIVIGLTAGEAAAGEVLRTLAERAYDGDILLFGLRASPPLLSASKHSPCNSAFHCCRRSSCPSTGSDCGTALPGFSLIHRSFL